MTAQQLIDAVHRLATQPRLTQDVVEDVLGLSLQPDHERSNPFFDVLRAAPVGETRALNGVEFRCPTERARGKGGILVLKLNPLSGLTAQLVEAAWGKPVEISVSPAPGVPDEAVTWVYRFDVSVVKVGIGGDRRESVASIVLSGT